MTYNRFIQGLKLAGVEVDRKILADLAVNDAAAFAALVEVAKRGRGRRRHRGAPLRPPGRRSTDASDPGAPAVHAGGRPRVVAARRLQRRTDRDAGRALPGRGPAGRARGPRRRRGAASSSSTAGRRCAAHRDAAARRRTSSPVTDEAHARRWPRPSHPQGLVAVCEQLDVPLGAGAGRAAAAGRGARRDPRPRQRRHRPADRRRRRRRARWSSPATPSTRTTASACGPRAGSLFHVDVVRAPDAARRSPRCATAGLPVLATAGYGATDLDDLADDGSLAAPTAWLFGTEAHGLPDDLLRRRRRGGPGADPRPRREPQPGRRRRGLPLRLRASARAQRRHGPIRRRHVGWHAVAQRRPVGGCAGGPVRGDERAVPCAAGGGGRTDCAQLSSWSHRSAAAQPRVPRPARRLD